MQSFTLAVIQNRPGFEKERNVRDVLRLIAHARRKGADVVCLPEIFVFPYVLSRLPEAAEKIVQVRKVVGPDIRVEVDGGIDPKTAPIVVSYGADTLVAGSAIFSKPDRIAAINAIREACK